MWHLLVRKAAAATVRFVARRSTEADRGRSGAIETRGKSSKTHQEPVALALCHNGGHSPQS